MVRRILQNIFSFQFLKFLVVGVFNTVIDFAVLNVLSYATGIYAGTGIIGLNIVSFLVAVTNSYFWNKFWTFRHGLPVRAREYSKFMAVNLGGAVINSGIVYVITTVAGPFGGIHPQLWLNVAKVVALPVSTIWNFLGAKRFIFRHRISAVSIPEATPDTTHHAEIRS